MASFGKFEAVAYRRAPCPQAWGGCVATSTARCCVKSPYLAALLPCGGDGERGKAAGCPPATSDLHAILRPQNMDGTAKSFASYCNRAVRTCPGAALDLPDLASLEPAFSRGDDLAAVETVRQTAIADQCHHHTRGAPQLRGRLAVASA